MLRVIDDVLVGRRVYIFTILNDVVTIINAVGYIFIGIRSARDFIEQSKVCCVGFFPENSHQGIRPSISAGCNLNLFGCHLLVLLNECCSKGCWYRVFVHIKIQNIISCLIYGVLVAVDQIAIQF